MANIVRTGFRGLGIEKAEYFAERGRDPLKHAFSKKFTVHAGSKNDMLESERIPAQYESLLQGGFNAPSVIYIHFPFCRTNCIYCGFSGPRPDEETTRVYVDSLIKEIGWLTRFDAVRGVPVRAVYMGGGTPSSACPADLARLNEALAKGFNLANDCEITLEGRTGDLVRAEEFIRAGFNRFSIGIQSFDTAIRTRLGRLNSREECLNLLSVLIGKQMAAVIIDLIYGLPGQSIDSFLDDLKTAESIGVDGLDTYQLNIFPDGRLLKAMEDGEIPPAAALDEQGEYYSAAYEYLTRNRWNSLSVSHYGRTSRERNIYNPWTKMKSNCIGIGAGAGGNINGWASYRIPVVGKYIKMIAAGMFMPDALMKPDLRQTLNSAIIGQVERGWVNKTMLEKESGPNREALYDVLANWEECGLVTARNEWLELTVSGRFWGVNLTQILIELMNAE
jgi:oxygen-independent coproporphyrinogen-3 oxidase